MAVKSLFNGIILGSLLVVGGASVSAQTPLGNLVSQVKRAVVIVTTYDDKANTLTNTSGFFIAPDRVLTSLRSIDSARTIRINSFSGNTIFVQCVLARYMDANIVILQLKEAFPDVALAVNTISQSN